MADRQISDLIAATQVTVDDLFVLEQNNTAKKLTGQILMNDLATALDGHGGVHDIAYTPPASPSLDGTMLITMADGTEYEVPVSNGNSVTNITQYWAVSTGNVNAPSTWYTTLQTMTTTNKYLWSYVKYTFADGTTINTTAQVIGVYGNTGQAWYVHIRYAPRNPISDADLGTTPDTWIGVYSGTSASAPTTRSSYTWYQWKGERGLTGNGISTVYKTSTSGLVDTYTVTFTDGNTTTFNITNGSNISTITKTSTNGLVDTYTVTLTNGNTTTFNVTNAKSITGVAFSSNSGGGAQGTPGTYDTYTISYNDGDTSNFTVYNGANGAGAVAKVDGIEAVGDDVPLLTIGNGAPTTATQGNIKSRYFDATNSVLYICVGYDSGTSTYDWRGTGVTVDSVLSTSSTNPVQNKVITNKVGTATLNTTATNLSGAINELVSDVGNMSLNTTASNLTAAINEILARVDNNLPSAISSDLNTMVTQKAQIMRWDSGTLHTPYTETLTLSAAGIAISYANNSDGTYAIQFALPSGNSEAFIRAKNNGTWTSWQVVGYDRAVSKSIAYSSIDSITESGIYKTTGTPGLIVHMEWDANYAIQIGSFDNARHDIQFRTKTWDGVNPATWIDWVKVEKQKLLFTSTSVATNAWASDSTYSDYGYKATIALAGVTSSMIPEVIFGMTEATSGTFAPVCETYNGGIYLYASSAPSSAITIPTIICWRGN